MLTDEQHQTSMLVQYHSDEVASYGQLRYSKKGDAGLDLYNAGPPIVINPGEHVEVPAGLNLKVPWGYVGLIRCRSSSFSKRGLMVVHNTIDSGYVGPMFTTVFHPGIKGKTEPQIIKTWEKLSQIIIVPFKEVKIVQVTEMPQTERGITGFGSTGR